MLKRDKPTRPRLNILATTMFDSKSFDSNSHPKSDTPVVSPNVDEVAVQCFCIFLLVSWVLILCTSSKSRSFRATTRTGLIVWSGKHSWYLSFSKYWKLVQNRQARVGNRQWFTNGRIKYCLRGGKIVEKVWRDSMTYTIARRNLFREHYELQNSSFLSSRFSAWKPIPKVFHLEVGTL